MTRRKVFGLFLMIPFISQMAKGGKFLQDGIRDYLKYHRLPPEIGWRGYWSDGSGRIVGVQSVSRSSFSCHGGFEYHWLPRGMAWLGYWTDQEGVVVAWERWDNSVDSFSPRVRAQDIPFLFLQSMPYESLRI